MVFSYLIVVSIMLLKYCYFCKTIRNVFQGSPEGWGGPRKLYFGAWFGKIMFE